jgi:hypothetical protein
VKIIVPHALLGGRQPLLSMKLEELAEHYPVLTFERDRVSDVSAKGNPTSKRVVRLNLEIGVNGVNDRR